jgi:copper resistance protein B
MMTCTIRPMLMLVISTISFTAQAAKGDDPLLYLFRAEQLELRDAEEGNLAVFEGYLWVGKDLNKLWIKSEVEASKDETEGAEWQFLYSRAIDTYWDLQIGLRTDVKPEPKRNWLALGFYGLSPYWFEIDSAIFIGEDDQVNLRLEAEYEFMLTQKWVLYPEIEINWFSEDDEELGIGSGMAQLEAGLRLRYEITRQIKPYIGIHHEQLHGDTKDIANAGGEKTSDTQAVAGIRFWF